MAAEFGFIFRWRTTKTVDDRGESPVQFVLSSLGAEINFRKAVDFRLVVKMEPFQTRLDVVEKIRVGALPQNSSVVIRLKGFLDLACLVGEVQNHRFFLARMNAVK